VVERQDEEGRKSFGQPNLAKMEKKRSWGNWGPGESETWGALQPTNRGSFGYRTDEGFNKFVHPSMKETAYTQCPWLLLLRSHSYVSYCGDDAPCTTHRLEECINPTGCRCCSPWKAPFVAQRRRSFPSCTDPYTTETEIAALSHLPH
jgi:hypothetical protein